MFNPVMHDKDTPIEGDGWVIDEPGAHDDRCQVIDRNKPAAGGASASEPPAPTATRKAPARRKPVPLGKRIARIVLGPPARKPAGRPARKPSASVQRRSRKPAPARPASSAKSSAPRRPAGKPVERLAARKGSVTFPRVCTVLAALLVVPAVPLVLAGLLALWAALSAVFSAIGALIPAGALLWAARHPDRIRALAARVRRFDVRNAVKGLLRDPEFIRPAADPATPGK